MVQNSPKVTKKVLVFRKVARSCSLTKKLLKILKVAKKLPSRIWKGLQPLFCKLIKQHERFVAAEPIPILLTTSSKIHNTDRRFCSSTVVINELLSL